MTEEKDNYFDTFLDFPADIAAPLNVLSIFREINKRIKEKRERNEKAKTKK